MTLDAANIPSPPSFIGRLILRYPPGTRSLDSVFFLTPSTGVIHPCAFFSTKRRHQ